MSLRALQDTTHSNEVEFYLYNSVRLFAVAPGKITSINAEWLARLVDRG